VSRGLSSPWALLVPALAACAPSTRPNVPPPGAELATAESLYADLRDLRDRIEISTASGSTTTRDTSLVTLIRNHNRLRAEVGARLSGIDSVGLAVTDARALGIMRRTLARDLDSLPPVTPSGSTGERTPDCTYDPVAVAAGRNGLESLRERMYRCYGWAQSHVVVGSDTLDRLTVLGALGHTADVGRRRQLFLALDPVWRSVNRDNGASSPYRQLIAAEMRAHTGTGLPSLSQAAASGVEPDSLEGWLTALLTAWRRGTKDSLIEPWDWYYENGSLSRALSSLVSSERLLEINAELYRSLGADVKRLGIHYDTEPREGKTPVAFTTFGARARLLNGRWRPAEPWIFATYRTGGLDNLNELLHETGHAVHIAAIRTRPAFADWPDSDPFTEAVADFVALEVYEPSWQQRWLGDSVPLQVGLRARYAGIVLDVAWALFELAMQRNPSRNPNQVWTALTRDYLRIRPHPELSWWAMRGQLIDSPGYMMNYAAGAILIAAIRARTEALHGSFRGGDPTWYRWIAPRLFRFGLERPSREVVEEFLGGPVSPAAILEDMRRIHKGTRNQEPGTGR
jgi:hypothetical protein